MVTGINNNSVSEMISVIIPIYNCELYLERCLNALRKQTYKNIEFILINDGSTDNSADICKKFCKSDERFKYFYQDNSGVSSARNLGIEKSIGSLIGFCDADDYAETDLYEFLYFLLNKNNCDIAVCGFNWEDKNQETLNPPPPILEGEKYLVNLDEMFCQTLKYNNFGGYLWNKLFKKTIISDIKFEENISVCEDLLFVCEALIKSTGIAFSSEKKYHYVQNSCSALHQSLSEKYLSLLTSVKKIACLVEKNCESQIPLAYRVCVDAYFEIILRLVSIGNLNRENYKSLRSEMKPYVKIAKKLMPFKRRILLGIFMLSRKCFSAILKIFKKI